MELFLEYERHGPLVAGGLDDQPAFETYAIDCVRSARDNAKAWQQRVEAHKAHHEHEDADESEEAEMSDLS